MQMVDFNQYEQNQRMYGGTAGRKMGIVYEGKNYILKFPGNLKEQQMKNIQLSYSNSPVCEYIGSQIYGLLGFSVHDTVLGFRNGKTVVACGDFLEDGDRLYEFDKIKVTFDPPFLDSSGNETNGVGVDLYEILMTIQEHPFLKGLDLVQEHFWNMFVVDALIGNTDRNNSNWGVIVRANGKKELAPIYDNGNCLNSKWDGEKMQAVLSNEKNMETEAFSARRCIFELKDKKLNPYHLIERMEYEGCNNAVRNITPKVAAALPEIEKMILGIPVLTEIQKKFYLAVMGERYEKVLKPTCHKIMGHEMEVERQTESREERMCR